MKVGVIGAGISGLCTAYHLQKLGADVTVFEASPRVGGAISSFRDGEFLAEEGPHTILNSNPEVDRLVDELGISGQRVFANGVSNKRFAVRDGRVQAMPMSPPAFAQTPLYSTAAKLRLLLEPFIEPSDQPDESVTSFVERRLGEEFLNYGVDLMVNGIWAGDPNRLSVRHAFKRMYGLERDHGSLIKGAINMGRNRAEDAARPHMFAFEQGNQTLTDALASKLDEVILDAPVVKLQRKDGRWTIRFRKSGGTRSRRVDAVVLTAPLYAQSSITIEIDGKVLQPSMPVDIEHPSLAVLTLGFRREDVGHPLDGFGMLVPEVEERDVLGAMFTSTLFPKRAPDGHVTMAIFIGGSRHGELLDLNFEDRKALALAELKDLLQVRANPVWHHEKIWYQGIPQYEVGYGKNLAAMQAIEKQCPGLYLHGNFRDGVAVPDLIKNAKLNAMDILSATASS